MTPVSKQSTLFPEPGSSGKSVLYFVFPHNLFPLVAPRGTVVKLPFLVYFVFRCADEQKFQFLPSFLPDVNFHRSGPTSGIGHCGTICSIFRTSRWLRLSP